MKNKIKICVVGTGPSSISVAKYFSSISDIDLTIIDIGNTSKDYSKNYKSSLIPKKSFFGNFFMYQRKDKLKIIHKANVDFDTSHALGGLSTVWGANISYLNNIYFKKWNISPSKFLDAFNFVANFIPHISINDDMDKNHDYKFNSTHFIEKPNFENKRKLHSDLTFGLSKLAINQKLCTKCTRCMEGCSYGAIFNSKNILHDLLSFRNITYKNNLQALRFVEKDKVITLTSKNLANGKTIEHQFDHLFIGAGVLDSTLIHSRSLAGNKNFKIKESKKFYKIFVSLGKIKSDLNDNISLSHYFIKHKQNDSIIHSQLYSLFFILRFMVNQKFGSKYEFILTPFKFILKKMYLCMIYLDSEDSGYINLKFSSDLNSCICEGVESSASKIRLKKFLRSLREEYFRYKIFPLPFTLSSKLGHSQHFGSTLPMKKNPKENEVDLLGRPVGFSRISFIDASILPTIPSAPTTINVMANAVRICSEIYHKILSKRADGDKFNDAI